ncbi:MAG: site-specific integrase [Cyclobacteriaceae bacterium]|nr:site-specific integrase [Cyclobacteriaceae bacterium]MCX7637778.1 site-specific integrase [Cyclobacteriaceae bacterium]MDW8332435.1 tyrosine-type recombinase/integrase [Cyclobacteriaceae bacterium]
MDLSKFSISLGVHRNKNVIWIRFEKNNEWLAMLRKEIYVLWSASQKCWYAYDTAYNRQLLGLDPKITGKSVIKKIHDVNKPALQAFINTLKLKAYSENTIRIYVQEFSQLLYILKSYPVQNLTAEKLRSYFLYCINELKIKENHLNSRINAIKFYFEQVLGKEKLLLNIPRPKKPSKLPKVIDMKDVKTMLSMVKNTKHRVMLKLCYGMGLRVSEIVNLKISDIDSKRMQVHICSGKGKRDRYANLPESVLEDLRTYYKEYKPKYFLFEGQYGGQYSVRSVQQVFKQAMKKAKIKKQIGIHGLRHSYATHLLEQGTDISLIKELLGHKDLKTTLIYTHISNKTLSKVKSPLDSL